jgi:hypothetical protein
MMLFLANIGSSTATVFKFIYLRINLFKKKSKFIKFKNDAIFKSEFESQFFNDYDSSNQNFHSYEENIETKEGKMIPTLTANKEMHHSEQDYDVQKSNNKSTKYFKRVSSASDIEGKKNNSKNLVRKTSQNETDRTYSVSIGIRDVEIPQKYISFMLEENEKKIENQKENNVMSNDNLQEPNRIDEFKNESDILKAIKRIDSLIEKKSDDSSFHRLFEQDDFNQIDNYELNFDEDLNNNSILPAIFSNRLHSAESMLFF